MPDATTSCIAGMLHPGQWEMSSTKPFSNFFPLSHPSYRIDKVYNLSVLRPSRYRYSAYLNQPSLTSRCFRYSSLGRTFKSRYLYNYQNHGIYSTSRAIAKHTNLLRALIPISTYIREPILKESPMARRKFFPEQSPTLVNQTIHVGRESGFPSERLTAKRYPTTWQRIRCNSG